MLTLFSVRSPVDEKISGSLSPLLPESHNPFMLLSMLPSMLPRVGQSRMLPMPAGLQHQVSAGSEGRFSKLPVPSVAGEWMSIFVDICCCVRE